MRNFTSPLLAALMIAAPIATLAASLGAQSVTIDYPDSVIGAAAGQYPIYTGSGTNLIRGQSLCLGTFANLPTTPMLCSRVGIQLANSAQYAKFVLRFGATSVPALTTTWATNLPDQRVQLDLSGTTISGGAGVNIWVEYELDSPFYYTPGQGIVLDITSQAAVAGQYARTAIGTGVPRLVDSNYLGAATSGIAGTSGGIKFRMVFEPLGLVQHGSGCPGTGAFVPQIGAIGTPTLGNAGFTVTLTQALGGSPCVFLLGQSALLDLSGGCKVYNDMLFSASLPTGGSGAGAGTAAIPLPIPNDTSLLTQVLNAQWGVLDFASGAIVPITLSAGGKIVFF